MKKQTALDRRAKKAAYDKARRARAREAKKQAAQPPKDATPPQSPKDSVPPIPLRSIYEKYRGKINVATWRKMFAAAQRGEPWPAHVCGILSKEDVDAMYRWDNTAGAQPAPVCGLHSSDQASARSHRMPPDISVRFEVRQHPRPLSEVEREELKTILDRKGASERSVMEKALKVETLREMLRVAELDLIEARKSYENDTTKADVLFSRLATP